MRPLLLLLFLPACSADSFTQGDAEVDAKVNEDAISFEDGSSHDDAREDAYEAKDGGIDALDAGDAIAIVDASTSDGWDGSCPYSVAPESSGTLACGTSTCSGQVCCEYTSTLQCQSSSCGSGDYWVWRCSSTEQCGSGKVCTANTGSTTLSTTCPSKLVLKAGSQALIDCSTTSWGYQFCASDVGCPSTKKCVKTEVSIFGGSTSKTVGLCQ